MIDISISIYIQKNNIARGMWIRLRVVVNASLVQLPNPMFKGTLFQAPYRE